MIQLDEKQSVHCTKMLYLMSAGGARNGSIVDEQAVKSG